MSNSTTITVNVDPDQMDTWIEQDLRRCYIDAKTLWHHDVKYNEQLCDALLTVIEHYMPHAEFEAWYETIKEL